MSLYCNREAILGDWAASRTESETRVSREGRPETPEYAHVGPAPSERRKREHGCNRA